MDLTDSHSRFVLAIPSTGAWLLSLKKPQFSLRQELPERFILHSNGASGIFAGAQLPLEKHRRLFCELLQIQTTASPGGADPAASMSKINKQHRH